MNQEHERLRELIAILHEYDLDALTVRRGDTTYELVARHAGKGAEPPELAAAPSHPVEASQPALPATNVNKVTAPIIGVFYRASSPGAEAFVEVGARVEVGQPLCILEAMKMMNEITSDYAGIVRRVLPENGALVSLGEELFWIEP